MAPSLIVPCLLCGGRYTGLSKGFPRTLENRMVAAAIDDFAYNFVKIHSTVRTSPAMGGCLWNLSAMLAPYD